MDTFAVNYHPPGTRRIINFESTSSTLIQNWSADSKLIRRRVIIIRVYIHRCLLFPATMTLPVLYVVVWSLPGRISAWWSDVRRTTVSVPVSSTQTPSLEQLNWPMLGVKVSHFFSNLTSSLHLYTTWHNMSLIYILLNKLSYKETMFFSNYGHLELPFRFKH